MRKNANLVQVRSLAELKERSQETRYDALFCGSSFHRGRWKDAVVVIRIILGSLPVIFLSRQESPKDWMEVFEAGGFDLQAPPYNPPADARCIGASRGIASRPGFPRQP